MSQKERLKLNHFKEVDDNLSMSFLFKKITFFVFFSAFILIGHNLFSAEDVAEEEDNSFKVLPDLKKSKQDLFDEMIQKEPYKAIYEKCQKANVDDIGSCIWEGHDDGGKKIKGLTDVQKKAANKELEGSSSPGQEENNKKYEALQISNLENSGPDKALQKVKDYFSNKLREALYGDIKSEAVKDKIQIVDHGTFYDLFENRLSKNIVEALSSYCIEAKPFQLEHSHFEGKDEQATSLIAFVVSKNAKERSLLREQNLGKLSQTTIVGGNKKSIKAYDDWSRCIVSIDQMCTGFKYVCETANCQTKISKNINCQSIADREDSKECDDKNKEGKKYKNKDFAYTKGRACAVTNYMKSARQSLLAIATVKKKWDERGKEIGSDFAIFSTSKAACLKKDSKTGLCTEYKEIINYNPNNKKTGINAVNTLTSNELINNSGFKEEAKEIEKEFKKCSIDKDQDICKKFISKNRKEKEKTLAEVSLRSKIMAEKLDSDQFNKKEVSHYLKEQGYSDEQIKKQIEDEDKIEILKTEIARKYKAEREGLLKELRRQMEASTAKEKKYDPGNDQEAIANIGSEIKERTKKFQQLVHFNNIVSGYLDVSSEKSDGSKESSKNTASLYAEINNPDHTVLNQKKENIELIRKAASEAGISEPEENGEEEGNATLKVDDLNSEILDYNNFQQ